MKEQGLAISSLTLKPAKSKRMTQPNDRLTGGVGHLAWGGCLWISTQVKDSSTGKSSKEEFPAQGI